MSVHGRNCPSQHRYILSHHIRLCLSTYQRMRQSQDTETSWQCGRAGAAEMTTPTTACDDELAPRNALILQSKIHLMGCARYTQTSVCAGTVAPWVTVNCFQMSLLLRLFWVVDPVECAEPPDPQQSASPGLYQLCSTSRPRENSVPNSFFRIQGTRTRTATISINIIINGMEKQAQKKPSKVAGVRWVQAGCGRAFGPRRGSRGCFQLISFS